jgi:hypothetical protein
MSPPPTVSSGTDQAELSHAAVQLMKGVIYRDTHETVWTSLPRLMAALRDHFDVLGLQVVVDEAEGYAYLKSRLGDPDEPGPPRLVPRHQLSFQVSLLLALLRKKLAEFDASSSESRLVLSRAQIVEMVRVFLPDSSNEARLMDRIDTTINKVVDLGFLRAVRGASDTWEVRRIIKAFVDAEWLGEFDRRLAEYAALFAGGDDG